MNVFWQVDVSADNEFGDQAAALARDNLLAISRRERHGEECHHNAQQYPFCHSQQQTHLMVKSRQVDGINSTRDHPKNEPDCNRCGGIQSQHRSQSIPRCLLAKEGGEGCAVAKRYE